VIVLIGILVLFLGTSWPASRSQFLSYRDPSGVMITYPSDWRLASDKPGMVILAGPRAPWGRPAATIVVTHGGETTTLRHLLAAAVRGVGTGQPLHYLGERRLGSQRIASYYTRGDGASAQYLMVGVAARAGCAIVVIGIDSLRDPMLRSRTEVLQGILVDLIFPRHVSITSTPVDSPLPR
jgi:hypothetical protein